MRRAFLLLALLLTTVALAGCGGDATSIDPVAEAAQKTTDVSGAHFLMSAKITAPDGETVAFRGPGEIANHGKNVHMQMTMPAELLGIKGAAKGDMVIEFVSDGNEFYFRGGPFTKLAQGKWVRVATNQSQFDLGQNDPSKMLEYLHATSKVEERGTETVRGVDTTHYSARIQLDRVADRVSPKAAKALKRLTEGAGIKEIPLDVWVDDQGLVRRIKMNWHPQGGTIAVALDLFGFGDVQVAVPDKSDTTSLNGLIGGS